MQNIRPISALLAIALAFVVFDRCLAAEDLQAIEIPGDRAFMESITAGPDGMTTGRLSDFEEAVGTLLLDNQASRAIVFTSALEEHLRIPMAAKMTIMNSQPVRGYGRISMR